jgi:hypothetical protein
VTPASVQDRDAAVPVLREVHREHPTVSKVWVDGAYDGQVIDDPGAETSIDIEMVKRSDDVKGFEVVFPSAGLESASTAAAFVVDDDALADVASREGSVDVSRGVAGGSGVAVDVSQASVRGPARRARGPSSRAPSLVVELDDRRVAREDFVVELEDSVVTVAFRVIDVVVSIVDVVVPIVDVDGSRVELDGSIVDAERPVIDASRARLSFDERGLSA